MDLVPFIIVDFNNTTNDNSIVIATIRASGIQ